MTPNEVRRLRKIVSPIAERYGVAKMSLFGSRARGEERPDSDYDFWISKGRLKGLFALGGLMSDLESALGAPVDVIVESCDDSEIMEAVRNDEVLLYEPARRRKMIANYTACFTKSDERYIGQLLEWPEVITEGSTLDECRAMLVDAAQEMALAYQETGREVSKTPFYLQTLPVPLNLAAVAHVC